VISTPELCSRRQCRLASAKIYPQADDERHGCAGDRVNEMFAPRFGPGFVVHAGSFGGLRFSAGCARHRHRLDLASTVAKVMAARRQLSGGAVRRLTTIRTAAHTTNMNIA